MEFCFLFLELPGTDLLSYWTFVPLPNFIYNRFMLPHIINIHLGLFCLFHFVAGLFTLGPKSWVQSFTKKVYSLNIPESYESRYEATLVGQLSDAFGFPFKRSLGNIIFNVLLSFFTLSLAALRF